MQFGLAKRIDSLQATLLQVRKETDDEISRLRDELLAKNRTLERLESQLREQTDYDDLKRQSEGVRISMIPIYPFVLSKRRNAVPAQLLRNWVQIPTSRIMSSGRAFAASKAPILPPQISRKIRP